MAIAGNDIPQMLKEMTPHNEAKLKPRRGTGSAQIINTPSPCEASTISPESSNIVGMPQKQGKRR